MIANCINISGYCGTRGGEAMRIASTVLVLLLTSCASIEPRAIEPRETRRPSGNLAYSMTCSGQGRTLDLCYKKANELCPNGYNIIYKITDVVTIRSRTGVTEIPVDLLKIACSD